MAKAAGAECLALDVIFPVRRRQDDGSGPGELKENALEGGQPRRVDMLHDFDDSGGSEALQPLVAVHQGAVDQMTVQESAACTRA